MARKYGFPYEDYLTSNPYINQAVMQWFWEGENFTGGGAREDKGNIIEKHFPEIADMIDDLITLEQLPDGFWDKAEEYDSVLMASTAGDLWITFSKMVPPKKKGDVGFFKGGFKIIIGRQDGNLSFDFRKK